MSPAISKGKAKAVERTPLLREHGESAEGTLSEGRQLDSASRPPMSQARRSHLLTGVLVLLSICFAFILGIFLLAESYAAPAREIINRGLSESGEKFWRAAVPMRGPDSVNIVNVGLREDGTGASRLQVNVSVSMRMTVDTDFVMGFREENASTDGWWTRTWKNIGRWGVRRLGRTTVTLNSVKVYPSSPTALTIPLVTIKPLSPISITLSPGLSGDKTTSLSSLAPVSILLLVQPSQNASYLHEFVEKSWALASANVRIDGSDIVLCGGYSHFRPPQWWQVSRWRNWLRSQKPEMSLQLTFPIPPLRLPSRPPILPGSSLPALSDLLILESFSIASAPSPVTPKPVPSSTPYDLEPFVSHRGLDGVNVNAFPKQEVLTHTRIPSVRPVQLQSGFLSDAPNVILSARVSFPHPFSDFASRLGLNMPPLPLMIALPIPQGRNTSTSVLLHTPAGKRKPADLISVAQVFASPTFNTTHMRIPLSGYILPLSNSSGGLADAISTFASSYLSYQPAAIAVFTPLYPSLVVRASFPPPSTRLRILRNVTIENMSIRPEFGPIFVPDSDQRLVPGSMEPPLKALDLLASATVHARAVLPPGVNIDIDVKHVWIDSLVFDGELPPEVGFQIHGSEHAKLPEERKPAPVSGFGVPPVPQPRPLPDPLPERAFARITPRNWLNASSSRIDLKGQDTGDNHGVEGGDVNDNGTNVFVTAKIVDVPLEVLPGRGDELSRFITKILFSNEPVTAGIRGVAAVGVSVPGLTASTGPEQEGNELVLTGLPFEGNLKVGGRKHYEYI